MRPPCACWPASRKLSITRAVFAFNSANVEGWGLGLITPAEAKRVIMEDIGIGEPWAQNEVERYTYRMPGQATAYYYGYSKMQALRAQVELKLQGKFNKQAFHDFVLDQGMLPPHILKAAVMDEFVPSQLNQAR